MLHCIFGRASFRPHWVLLCQGSETRQSTLVPKMTQTMIHHNREKYCSQNQRQRPTPCQACFNRAQIANCMYYLTYLLRVEIVVRWGGIFWWQWWVNLSLVGAWGVSGHSACCLNSLRDGRHICSVSWCVVSLS